MALSLLAPLASTSGIAWLLAAGVLWILLNPMNRWRYRNVPGYPHRPLVGNLPEFMTIGSHELMRKGGEKYGPVFKIWVGSRPWVIITDADAGRKVNMRWINRPSSLTNPIARGQARQQDLQGLVLARDDTWSTLRKAWQPAFHSESLSKYMPLMASCTQALVQRLQQLAPTGQAVDIWREIGNLTLGVVGTTAYGVDFHTQDLLNKSTPATSPEVSDTHPKATSDQDRQNPSTQQQQRQQGEEEASVEPPVQSSELVSACQMLFQAADISRGSPYALAAVLLPQLAKGIALLAAALPDSRLKATLKARQALQRNSQYLIDVTRKQKAAATAASGGAGGATGKAPKQLGIAPGSFLGALMAARDKGGNALTDMQLIAQSNTFTLAGYETTANAISFAIYCVAADPDAQAALLKEVDAHGRDTPITYDDLEKFPFACACIDEALRMYPPGASTIRQNAEDSQICGVEVPADSVLVTSLWSIHRDPAYYENPDTFMPQRWLPGNEALLPKTPAAYLPFGQGARMCVGWRFALQEARLTLVLLYRSLTFELAPPTAGKPLRVRNGITLSPADGIWVRPVPRA